MVSIIILCHDKSDYTKACLRRLLQTDYRPLELIIVDNGSQDQTPEVLSEAAEIFERQGIFLRVITNPTNTGAVCGRNQAMQIVEGTYLVFMDNDVLVREGSWLSQLRRRLEETENTGIVCPKLLFPWPPYLIEYAGGAVSQGGRVQYLGRGEPCDAVEFNREKELQCTISACILFRRQVMEQIGLLDEAFSPVQFEDIDYSYRAREAGWKILFVPQVSLFHFENVTTEGSVDLSFKYLTIKNGLTFRKKWQHLFSKENGPEDSEVVWKQIEKKGIEILTDGRT